MRFPRLSTADKLALLLFVLIVLMVIATGIEPRISVYQSF